MGKKKKTPIAHAEIVRLFAARLREVRVSRGMTQADVAQQAHVSVAYVGRLEAGGAAPGIDLVNRLAQALGTTLHDLVPTAEPTDTLDVLKAQAERLFRTVLEGGGRETFLYLNPLLQLLSEKTK